MTVEQLKQYRSICAEIEEKTIELNENIMRDAVKGSDVEYPYIQHTIQIAGRNDDKRIKDHINKLKKQKTNIENFVDGIEDSLTRRIFEYRYIKGKVIPSWQSVAFKVGGNTGKGVQMIASRYMKKRSI